jgi:hypothetical protein
MPPIIANAGCVRIAGGVMNVTADERQVDFDRQCPAAVTARVVLRNSSAHDAQSSSANVGPRTSADFQLSQGHCLSWWFAPSEPECCLIAGPGAKSNAQHITAKIARCT